MLSDFLSCDVMTFFFFVCPFDFSFFIIKKNLMQPTWPVIRIALGSFDSGCTGWMDECALDK